MRSLSRLILGLAILAAAAPAVADKQFAHSKSLGVSFIAVGDPWCVPHITMRAEAGSADVFEKSEFSKIIRKLGHVLVRECDEASQMSISGTVDDLAIWSGSANKADGWVATTSPQQTEKHSLSQREGGANKADDRVAATTSGQSEVVTAVSAPSHRVGVTHTTNDQGAISNQQTAEKTLPSRGSASANETDSKIVTATRRPVESSAPTEKRLANPLLDKTAQSVYRFAQLADQCVLELQQDNLTDIPSPCVDMHPASDKASANMGELQKGLERGEFTTRELMQAQEFLAVYKNTSNSLSEVKLLMDAHNQRLKKNRLERQSKLDEYEKILKDAESHGQQCVEYLSNNLRTYQVGPCEKYTDRIDSIQAVMASVREMVKQGDVKQGDMDQVERIVASYQRYGELLQEFDRLMDLRKEKRAEGSEERVKKVQTNIAELDQIDLAGKQCVQSLTEYDPALINGCGPFGEAMRKEPPGRFYQLADEIQKQLDTLPVSMLKEQAARVVKVAERIKANSRRIDSLMEQRKQTPIDKIALVLDQIDDAGQKCIDGFFEKDDAKMKECPRFSAAMKEKGFFRKTVFVMVIVNQRDDLSSEESAELTRLSEVSQRTRKNWAKLKKIIEIVNEKKSAKQSE